jgi:mono/diheme cytochrome c family protein
MALCSGILLACSAAGAADAAPTAEQIEFFERQVRPVLVEHCISCHGPEKQKHNLRLDTRAAMLYGGDSGPALSVGNPEASLIVKAVRRLGDLEMPPDAPLEQPQIDAIAAWVAMGAPWPEEAGATPALSTPAELLAWSRAHHWAFQPVRKPEPPAVAETLCTAHPIDRFVGARLAEAGLAFSPEADARTLMRRVHYDLTGIPPTAAEVDAFAASPTEEAYAAVVDRLLASPQFGERWARYWLDLARYADTKGYVFQEDRNFPFSYTYRDFVIRAFNEDLPYDQFIRLQLAADQMELEDRRDLAAMGILSLGRAFVGNIHDQIDDKIDVISRGLMGLTMSCARCHDHKFDPITQADYYAMYGVFRSSQPPAELPLITEPDPENPLYQEYTTKLEELEADLDRHLHKLLAEALQETREKAADYLLAAHDARDITETEPFRTLARDRGLRWQLVDRFRSWLKARAESGAQDPVFGPWFAFAALPPDGFDVRADEITLITATNTLADRRVNAIIAKSFEGETPRSMAEVAERYRNAFAKVEARWKEYLATASQMAAKKGEAAPLPQALPDADAEALRQVLYAADSPANIALSEVWDLSTVPVQNTIRDRRNRIANHKATHPGRPDRAMTLVDAAKPFDPYVFKRGKPENRGEAVPRRFLEVLAKDEPVPFTQGSGRRELAEAIASGDNPLTARVYVNRVWLALMGSALVDTVSDFGLRSDPPTNPELLDWLAADFVEHGWSVKRLIREIVLSRAYRQSSAAHAQGLEKDPENRLYWRQNRKRMDLESMRDAMLAASGRLDCSRVGGMSVDILAQPFSPRRTVYAHIERQNLPNFFRTFDFAIPDTHAPRRYKTSVPQQALYFLNSPFVAEQARSMAARASRAAFTHAGVIAQFFAMTLQRAPEPEETALALRFLEEARKDKIPGNPWSYGYGVRGEDGRTASFFPYRKFTGAAWQVGEAMPDPALGWLNWSAGGGHPETRHATILRWTAPEDAVIGVDGAIEHPSEHGDGVIAYIVSGTLGELWRGTARRGKTPAVLREVAVAAGDTLDFVVEAGPSADYDNFAWAPVIAVQPTGGDAPARAWSAREEFHGPDAAQLTPRQQLAQVLLMSNEFLFVD